MSPFNFCVVSCLVLAAGVQSYVIRKEAHISFVDNADPSKDWKSDNDVKLTERTEAMSTTSTTGNIPTTVEKVDREGLSGNGCPFGSRRAGPTCVKDEDYESESDEVETADRDGITGGFKNCPEGYKRAGPACVPEDSDFENKLNKPVNLPALNTCPLGYQRAGPTCVQKMDYESYENE